MHIDRANASTLDNDRAPRARGGGALSRGSHPASNEYNGDRPKPLDDERAAIGRTHVTRRRGFYIDNTYRIVDRRMSKFLFTR